MLAVIVSSVGCSNASTKNQLPISPVHLVRTKPMISTVSSRRDLDEALRSRQLIIHIDVDWSMQAIESRPVVAELQLVLKNDKEFADLDFRRVDLTNQEGEVWDAVDTWISRQNVNKMLMSSGNGALLWVRSGVVVDSVQSAKETGLQKAVARTRRAFDDRMSRKS